MQSGKVCESSVLQGNYLAHQRKSLTTLHKVFNLYHTSLAMSSHKDLSGDQTEGLPEIPTIKLQKS